MALDLVYEVYRQLWRDVKSGEVIDMVGVRCRLIEALDLFEVGNEQVAVTRRSGSR